MRIADWLFKRVQSHVDYHQHRYARTVASLLAPDSRWLDIGAGSRIHGGWVPPLPQELRAKARSLIGFDVQSDHLREHPMLSAAAVGFAEHLPFRSGSMDLVSANMVLEHLVDPMAVFAEISRVLRPGGSFVFVTPNRNHPVIALLSLLLKPQSRRLLARVVEHKRAADRVFLTHYRANTHGTLSRLARARGFEVETLSPFSSYPMFSRFVPLLVLEVLWIRVLAHEGGPYPRGGSNLIGVLRKPGARGRGCPARAGSDAPRFAEC